MEKERYSFGEFDVDAGRRVLTRRGQPVAVNAKAFDLLLTLVRGRGELLTKNELLDRVWENQFVEENNLTVQVAALRKALGEKPGEHRYIVTVPGKGYRFVAPLNGHADEIVVEHRKVERIVIEEHEPGPAVEPSGQRTLPASRTRSLTWLVAGSVAAVLLFAGGFIYWREDEPTTVTDLTRPTLSRLTSTGRVRMASISPDGKYFAFAQEEPGGQSLWVRQVGESRNVELIPPRPDEYWGLTFSPAGTHVYATVFTPTQADPKLLRIPALGGVIEELPNVSCSAVTFSPDGSRFAYVVSSSGARATVLRTANADGSDDRELAYVRDPSFFVYPGSTLVWAPDGRSIVVATKVVDDNGEHGVLTQVDAATGQMEHVAMRKFPSVENVAWSPTGGLLFTANDDAASPMQVWQQLAGSDAARVTNDLNWYTSLAVSTRGDRLLSVQNVTTSGMWVAPFDGSIGEARQIATEMDDYGEIGWTPDSKLIHRSSTTGKQNLWSIDGDGASHRQISLDTMPDKGLSVSPDGRYIVFSSFRAGRYNLWRVNSDGGGLTQLTQGSGEVYPRFLPDGLSLIYQHGTGGGRSSIRRLSVNGGEPVMVIPEHAIFPAVSSDGKRIAYFFMDRSRTTKGEWRIGIAETETGSVIQTLSVPEDIIGRVVRWTPDGTSIVFAKSNGNIGNLWRQPVGGGPPEQITNFDSQTIGDFAWSRDGMQIAITRSNRSRDAVLISPK